MTREVPKIQRLAQVGRAFTPSAPIDDVDLFAGRLGQVGDVVSAVQQRGQHVALYGERGVGKTSLANIIGPLLTNLPGMPSDLKVAKINCTTNDDFATLWANVFRNLNGDGSPTGTPEDVRHFLADLDHPTLIILDELDRLEDQEAVSMLADTVKTVSDHAVPTTLVLVGVADNVDQLIGDHRSIERALVQVGMPRMSIQELAETIDKGCEFAELTIAEQPKHQIARLSEGLPHYAHLLCLHAGQRTVADDRSEITLADVKSAIDFAVEKHSIRSDYQLAVRSPKKSNRFPEVLLACALAPKLDLGYFPAGAVREPLAAIRKRPVTIASYVRHLNKFTQPERGGVLEQIGEERRFFYRFKNPILQPYVVLSGIATGLIDDETLRRLQQNSGAFEGTEPQQLF